MHYLGSTALVVWIFFATTQNLLANDDAGACQPTQQQAPVASVELWMNNGVLTFLQSGVHTGKCELVNAKPYHIVTSGTPALLTTCNENLEVVTIVASSTPRSYPNMLPVHIDSPFAVLAEIMVPELAQNGGASLVDEDGTLIWHDEDGMLLHPVNGELPRCHYMFVSTPGSTPIMPMGDNAELVLVNASTKSELWRRQLLLNNNTPFDVQLLAVNDDRCLLLLQYGYVSFEFVVMELAGGEFLQNWKFTGQVASQMLFPGGFSRLTPFELDHNIASLLVLNLDESVQLWSINLVTLSLAKSPAKFNTRLIDENTLPIGGTDIPDSSNPPFPQDILPTQHGNEWTIQALVDNNNRVLVVIGNEAMWMSCN